MAGRLKGLSGLDPGKGGWNKGLKTRTRETVLSTEKR